MQFPSSRSVKMPFRLGLPFTFFGRAHGTPPTSWLARDGVKTLFVQECDYGPDDVWLCVLFI